MSKNSIFRSPAQTIVKVEQGLESVARKTLNTADKAVLGTVHKARNVLIGTVKGADKLVTTAVKSAENAVNAVNKATKGGSCGSTQTLAGGKKKVHKSHPKMQKGFPKTHKKKDAAKH